MKNIKLVSSLALAAAVFALPAAGKELRSVAVCGASDCVTYTSRHQAELLANAGNTETQPAPAGPYYVLTFKGAAGGESFAWKAFYVPSTGQTVGFDESVGQMHWADALPAARPILAAATAKLDPFPAPTVESVRIDSEPVSGDPQSYLDLFAVEGAPAGDPARYDWVSVDLVAAALTPWTGSDHDLMFSPSARAIERGTARIELEDAVASQIDAGRTVSLAGNGLGWRTLGIVFAALAAAAAVALGLGAQRLRRGPQHRPTVA